MAFPTIQTTNFGSDGGTGSHSVGLPSGITAGDLLIVIFAHRQTTAQSWPAGWTLITSSGTEIIQARYRVADGSEGASITITSTSAPASWVSYRITGYDGTALVQGSGSASSGATPDPPSLTPTGGAKDYLWITTASLNDGGIAVTAAPTNYGSLIDSGGTVGASMSRTGAAVRTLNAASEDPGVFTTASGPPTSRCTTLAVHPAAAGGDVSLALTGVSSAAQAGDVETTGGTPVAYQTEVGISGAQWTINGVVTNLGTPAEGLLLNTRMINAIADNEDPTTVVDWEYPDTTTWDAQRNTDEFCAFLPTLAAAGVQLITVGLQGGFAGHGAGGNTQAPITTAFNADGSLKSAWFDRLAQVLDAADAVGIVVIVSVFYFGQDHRLTNDTAAQTALDNTVDWLVAAGYTNVLLEVANETYQGWYERLSLDSEAGVIAAIDSAQTRSGGALLVSASPSAGSTLSTTQVAAEDYVLIHGNTLTAAQLVTKIQGIKATAAYLATPKPILVNEDDGGMDKLVAAVGEGAAWGYYDQSMYQTMPVTWADNSEHTALFYAHTYGLTQTFGVMQGDSSESVGQVASMSVTLPVVPTVGNYLVAVHFTRSVTSTPPDGTWTAVLTLTNATEQDVCHLYVHPVVGGETTGPYTFTHTPSNDGGGLELLEVRGIASGTPDQTAQTGRTASVTALSTGTTAALTAAPGLAIAIAAVRIATTVEAWTNGFVMSGAMTGGLAAQEAILIIGTKVIDSVQTVESTASWAEARTAMAGVAVFTQAAEPGPPPMIVTFWQ